MGTVLRHGCASVTQLEMLPEGPPSRIEDNPWPQWPRVRKTDYGQQESIEIFGRNPRIYEATVREFLADEKGRVRQAVIDRLHWKTNAMGRIESALKKGEEMTVDADLVLIAAGFLGSENYVTDAFGVRTDARNNVETQQYRTNVEKVFAARAVFSRMGYTGRQRSRRCCRYLLDGIYKLRKYITND